MSDWSLVFEGYQPTLEGVRETLCTLGNGYFATRGAGIERDADEHHYPGTYFAGTYNRLISEVAGRSVENEDLVNWPNWLVLRVKRHGDTWLSPDSQEILYYRQTLDLREGVMRRDLRLRHGDGCVTRLTERRFVSMHDPHLAGLNVSITPENWEGGVTLCTALDGSVRNRGVARYRQLADRHLCYVASGESLSDTIHLVTRASQSGIEVAEAARTRLYRNGTLVQPATRTVERGDWIGQELDVEVHEGSTLEVEKLVSFYTSRDRGMSEPAYQAGRAISTAGRFDEHLERHANTWASLWDEFDFCIDAENDADAQLKLRVHVFHLLQTVSPHTLATDAGVPARGWHGEAYRGHVFWDEIFILPLLNLRMPLLTEALLRYRYRRLREARLAALEAGFSGAMFPWQSGSDGREESQSLHLNPQSGHWVPDNTHLQRHVNAAIAWSVWQYYQVTGNDEFIALIGAELLIEIARFFVSLADYDEGADRYDIRGVVGPDEFHTAYPDEEGERAGLDNNAYTNVMAAWVLARTIELVGQLPPQRRRDIVRRLSLGDDELERMERVSRRLRVVFHGDGIISQFEGYEALEELDWTAYREKYGDIQRLDRILESEGDTTNRYKASKQADVLMLFYLFSTEELTETFDRLGYDFPPETIPKTIEYYSARTADGSTLSYVVRSWVEARAARGDSWQQFIAALGIDIGDVQQGTTAEGIHLGAMAGTVDLLHRCYTGLETRGNTLHFAPALPQEVRRLDVRLRFRGQHLAVSVDRQRLHIESLQSRAPTVSVCCRGETRALRPGATVDFSLG